MPYNQTIGWFLLPADGFDLHPASSSFSEKILKYDYAAILSDGGFQRSRGSRNAPAVHLGRELRWGNPRQSWHDRALGTLSRSGDASGVFQSWITPVPHFFVRNHMHEPSTWDADGWKLTIGGEVENPLSVSLADLTKLEPHTVTNTLECAGNGRGFQQPKVPGVQWQRGAVGTARFTGPRLGDLLQRARVKANGKHVMFRGLDEVPARCRPSSAASRLRKQWMRTR